jgi:hypothetical protein
MKTTYNKSAIFRNAWSLVKTAGKSLSEALKAAWNKAKAPVKTLKEKAAAKLTTLKNEYVSYITFNIWEKGDQSRLYINRKGASSYIDLNTGEFNIAKYGASMRGLVTEVYEFINA